MRGIISLCAAVAVGFGLYHLSASWLVVGHGVALTVAIGGAMSVFGLVNDLWHVLANMPKLKRHVADSDANQAAALLDKMETVNGLAIASYLLGGTTALVFFLYYLLPWTASSSAGAFGKGVAAFVLAFIGLVAIMVVHVSRLGWQQVFMKQSPSLMLQLGVQTQMALIKKGRNRGMNLLGKTEAEKNLENLNAAINILSNTLKTADQKQKPVANSPAPVQSSTTANATGAPPAHRPITANPALPNPQSFHPPASSSTSTSPANHVLFISYSTDDKEVANRLCQYVEASGIPCWIAPRNVTPGAAWGEALVDAIESSKVFVLLMSGHANASKQVQREVERAVSKGIPVIPFRIENVPPSKAIEYFISSTHWLDAFTQPFESHCQQLASVVRSLVGLDDTSSHSKSVASHDGNSKSAKSSLAISVSLLDALCCVMMADGKADESEEQKIISLMNKVKSPLSDEEIHEHLDKFCVRVARRGFPSVLNECVESVHLFKSAGKQDTLIRFLDALAAADGIVDRSEAEVIERIKSAVT